MQEAYFKQDKWKEIHVQTHGNQSAQHQRQQKMVKAARDKGWIAHKEMRVEITADFAVEQYI